MTSVKLIQRPSKEDSPGDQSSRQARIVSSERAARSDGSMPSWANSAAFQPPPTPRVNRPPEIASRVAAWRASTA